MTQLVPFSRRGKNPPHDRARGGICGQLRQAKTFYSEAKNALMLRRVHFPGSDPHGEMSLHRQDGQEILSDLAVIYWARCDEMRAGQSVRKSGPPRKASPTGIPIL
jgi:hypothetical protein